MRKRKKATQDPATIRSRRYYFHIDTAQQGYNVVHMAVLSKIAEGGVNSLIL
jgi:hypothetical protein